MAGCHAFTPELRSVTWPGKFKLNLPPRYDGTADPTEFLQLYELSIKAANGDDKGCVCLGFSFNRFSCGLAVLAKQRC